MKTALGSHLQKCVESGTPLSEAEGVGIVQDLARQVETLHRAGTLHLEIGVESLEWDENPPYCRLRQPSTRVLWTRQGDGEPPLPPELESVPHLELSTSDEEARQTLQQLSIDVNPERIDVFQLAALFCRILTGQSVAEYLQSPRARGLIPVRLRRIIDAALGYDPRRRLGEVAALSAELERLNPETPTAHFDDDQIPDERCPVATEQDTDLSGSIHVPSDTDLGGVVERQASGESSLPFQRLGHFDITARIGHGGMGDVYRGYDQSLDREVAIKVLPPELSRHPELVGRFHAEAAAAAKLTHPNVVQIHYIGEDQGLHFFAMQHVEGESLAELLARRGRLPVDEALAVCEQALSGLEAAHERGLIHRDVKPGNILLDRRNRRALIADFGLVKFTEGAATATATGVIMGTVDYISPEQGRGSGTIDARTDLYSMGVVLYQMLSGKLPFVADSPTALIFQHVYEPAPRLDETAVHVPRDLARIVARLLQKSPNDRYRSANDVLADLRAFREGRSLPSEAAAPSGGALDRGRRQGTQIIHAPDLGAIPILPKGLVEETGARAAGMVDWAKARFRSLYHRHAPEFVRNLQNTQQQIDGAIYEYERRHRELGQLVSDAEEVADELDRQAADWNAVAAEAELKAQSASSEESTAAAQREGLRCREQAQELAAQAAAQREQLDLMRLRLDKVNATLQQLTSQRDVLNARLNLANAQLGKRQFEWKHVLTAPLNSGPAELVTARLALVAVVALAAVIIVRGQNSDVELATERQNAHSPVGDGATDVHGNPRSATLEPVTGPDGEKLIPLDGQVGAIVLGELDNGGKRVYCGLDRGDISIVTVHEQQSHIGQLPGHLRAVNALALTDDGTQLVSASDDNSIRVWMLPGAEGPREIRRLEGHTKRVTAVLVSGEGSRILSGGHDGTVRLWDVQAETQIDQFNMPWGLQEVGSLGWFEGAPEFVVTSPINDPRSTALWDLELGRSVRSLETAGSMVSYSTLLPREHACVGVNRGQCRVWNLDDGTETRAFGVEVRLAAFSLATNRALLAHGDHSLSLWDIRTGTQLKEFSAQPSPITSIAISRDGECAASAREDKILQFWTLPAVPPPAGQVAELELPQPVLSIAFAHHGNFAAIGHGTGSTIWMTDHPTHRYMRELNTPVTAIAVSPDGGRYLYGAGTTGSLQGELALRTTPTTSQMIFLQGDRVLRQFEGHSQAVVGLAFSNAGRNAVSASQDGAVRVWSLQSEQPVNTFDMQTPLATFDLCGDQRFAVVALNSGKVALHNLSDGTPASTLASEAAALLDLACSADGAYVAAAGADGQVYVWKTDDSSLVAELSGHTGRVLSVDISDDGESVLSGGEDGTVRHWSVADESEKQRFEGHTSSVTCVAFEPNEKLALSGGNDRFARFWRLTD